MPRKLVQWPRTRPPAIGHRRSARAPCAARPPQFPPSDLAALDAAEKASGVLSATANDPRNAPGTQPNPYTADEHFFKLPDGRHFGSTSSVAGDSKGHIWVAERCGANNCVGSPLDPVMEFDAKGNFIKSFGAGQILFPHGIFDRQPRSSLDRRRPCRCRGEEGR